MIDTKALRNKILDLAISGKLTEQLPEDGNAEDLYAQIQEEKERLIAEGKIKKEKPLPHITEEETPFDIPDNWKWVRLADVGFFISGYTPNASDLYDEGTYPYFKVANMNMDGNELYMMHTDSFLLEDTKKVFKKGTIVYPKNGGAVFTNKKRILFYDSVVDLNTGGFSNYGGVELLYLYNYFSTIDFNDYAKGSSVPTLDMARVKMLLFPLPPLAEQKRIVSAVEDAFAVIDRIEKAQESYYADQEVLKNKIIDAGIRGKLTEQLPEDGNAEDLYAQIQEEKARLIAEGKIKKEKPLPPIADEEIPFEIPENWKWVRLGEVATILGGKRIPAGRSLTSVNTGQKYIRVSDMKNRTVQTQNLLYVPDDIIPTIARYIINKEDVYITVAGTIGKVGKIPEEIDGANLTENADRIVFSSLSQDWLISCLEAEIVQKQIEDLTTQVAQPKLAIQRIQGFSIPLPPLLEQKRISRKIEKLLSII